MIWSSYLPGNLAQKSEKGKLFPFPAHAILGVLQNDALFGQVRADRVGARKVSCLASLRMFADEALNVGIRKSGGFGQFGGLRADLVRESFLLRPLDGCTHLSGIVVLQHGEDLLELPQHLEQPRNIALAYFSRVGCRIYVANHVKN